MLNKILLVIILVLLLVYVGIDGSKSTTFFSSPNINKIKVKDTTKNTIEKLNLEDYIIGVVAAEMPASFNEEALKAQAVASRTYAVYKMENNTREYDVVTDVSNQSYITVDEMKNKWKDDFDKYYNKVKNAVLNTKGEVMFYDNNVVEAYYFAMSNGYTENASLVFSEDRDYLQSVESIYDNENLKNFEVTKVYKKEEVCNKLNISCEGFEINNIERSNTGRVNKIVINNKGFKGTEVRKLLGLRSTDFTINIDNDNVSITTKGYGHGVGMSQYGANGMAKNGYSFDEILKYFYKNVEIVSI